MYKLIASDLDGTLLTDNKTISKETIDTLIQLNKKGVYFVPSTGRAHLELPEPIQQLPFLRYGLCVNGGGIYDYYKDEYIYEVTIDREKALEVYYFAQNLNVYSSYVEHGKRYLQADKNGVIVDFIQKVAVPSILKISYGCSDIENALKNGNGIQKFLFYGQDKEHTQQAVDILTKQFPNLSVCSSGPHYIEVNAKGVNKGTGLKILCEHLGIDIQDTIAFGDASNDIDLLDTAGLAVVMENGTEEAKRHADIIAQSNNDDGLRKVLENIYKL